eukprot:scaffold84423_cov18-Prasinocladus_malaysianus.AAC.1
MTPPNLQAGRDGWRCPSEQFEIAARAFRSSPPAPSPSVSLKLYVVRTTIVRTPYPKFCFVKLSYIYS